MMLLVKKQKCPTNNSVSFFFFFLIDKQFCFIYVLFFVLFPLPSFKFIYYSWLWFVSQLTFVLSFFRIHFVEEYVSALWWMVCSSKEMVTPNVKVNLNAVVVFIKLNQGGNEI